jgi:hypothetical protein
MKSIIQTKIKRKIGAVVVLGIFAALMLAQPVAAMDFNTEGDGFVGNDAEERIFFDDDTAEIEMLDAVVGIGDTSPDFKLEVTGSSGDGYFGVSSTDDNDDNGDIFKIASNGNVGIGTAIPGSKLEIKSGGATSVSSALHVKNSASTSLLYIRDDGNIGIGVTNPAEKLEISGNILFNFGSARSISVETCPTPDAAGNHLTVGAGNAVGGGISGYNGGNLYLRSGDGAGTGIGGGDGGDVYIYGGAKARLTGRDDGDIILGHTGSEARGKVGIGTASPGATLDVRGSAIFNEDRGDYDFRIEGDNDADLFCVDASADKIGIGTDTPDEKLVVGGNIKLPSGNKWIGLSSTQGMYIDSGGDAGFGTSSPIAQVQIESTTEQLRLGYNSNNFASFTVASDGYLTIKAEGGVPTGYADIELRTSNFDNSIFIDDEDTNVGIGTADPDQRLHVKSQASAMCMLKIDVTTQDYDSGIRLADAGTDKWYIVNDGSDDKLKIASDDGISSETRFTIQQNGNIGIGWASPSYELTIGDGIDDRIHFSASTDPETDPSTESVLIYFDGTDLIARNSNGDEITLANW